MTTLKWLSLIVLSLILHKMNDNNGVDGKPVDNRPRVPRSLQPDANIDNNSELQSSDYEDSTLATNSESNVTDNEDEKVSDYNEDDINPDEMMKTSQLFPFRPFFRHKQMMEDRRRRDEWKRRMEEEHRRMDEEKRLAQMGQSTKQSGSYVQYDRYNNVYLCNGQQCRPAKIVGYYPVQTPKPTMSAYYQNSPAWYYNGQYYNVNYANRNYPFNMSYS